MSEDFPTLYLKACDVGNGWYSVSIEALLIIHVFQICETDCIQLKFQLLDEQPRLNVKLHIAHIKHSIIKSELPISTSYCSWPLMIIGSTIVAGLCAVARQIIKSSNNEKVRNLLGFRESCLMACSEASIWTMFCEIDMPQSLGTILEDVFYGNNFAFTIPNSISRFEYHMGQPVRIHNIYKVAANNNKKKITMKTPKNELDLDHKYAEGPDMTISDVILYPCIDLFIRILSNDKFEFEEKFPLTYAWYKTMQNSSKFRLNISLPETKNSFNYSIDDNFPKETLYRSDMSHYKRDKKMYTKQQNIEKGLEIIEKSKIEVNNSNQSYADEISFSWEDIPNILNPCGGSLPEKRAHRKCEQLESMIKPVLKIVNSGNCTIVDFCSGSGHLGLVIAYLLPECRVILVENKELSLVRAKDRVDHLNLKNVTVVQSNLDYFSADFDVGISLHACGTATDLVMQTCFLRKAHFICCPCCYGGIKRCHLVNYPRSKVLSSLKDLTYNYYLSLAHAADQTHDSMNSKTKQGFLCMDVIDSDRKLYAEELGYDVFVGKLKPFTCTNKNNLIVGIKMS